MECAASTLVFFLGGLLVYLYEQRRNQIRINRAHRVHQKTASLPLLKQAIGPRQMRVLRRAFDGFAREVNGELLIGMVTGSPRVVFNFHGTRVMLSIHDTHAVPARLGGEVARFYTRLTFRLAQECPLRLEILPREPGVETPRLIDMLPARTGHSTFDDRHRIRVNDRALAGGFFDGPTRNLLAALHEMPPFMSAVVSLNAERLVLSKPSVILDPEILRRFERLGCRFYERIEDFVARLSGIELTVAAPEEADLPVCLICGCRIQDRGRVICGGCHTPYHEQCWHYNGRCAVFGCTADRFRIG